MAEQQTVDSSDMSAARSFVYDLDILSWFYEYANKYGIKIGWEEDCGGPRHGPVWTVQLFGTFNSFVICRRG